MGNKKHCKNHECESDAVSFLKQLNGYLEDYISDVIETGNGIDELPNATSLCSMAGSNNCWQVTDCRQIDCVSYKNRKERCWLTSGTLCNGKVQGEFAEKIGSCLQCKVYTSAHSSPENALIENINVLLFHLKVRAENLRNVAIHDGLTGLYNRQFFEEVMEREVAHAKRRHEKLGLMLVDVDKFKRINDTLGHVAGDTVLKSIANILSNSVRKTDLIFRFGGDEFVILLTNMKEGRVSRTEERINSELNDWNCGDQIIDCHIHLSIGSSLFDPQKESVHEALHNADQKMYAQKAEAV